MTNVIEIAEKRYIVMTEDECDGLIKLARISEMFSACHVMEMIK